jgi:phage shock protein E
MHSARRLLVAIVLAGALSVTAFAADHTKDDLKTVKKNIEEKKAILIDVRELTEWKEGHVKGAVLLPISELNKKVDEAKIQELVKDKKTIIYCHCGAGRRALKAGEMLEKLGYDVRPLKPGYFDLVEAGFEKVEQDAKAKDAKKDAPKTKEEKKP